MKKVYILALHLAFGGIEKAIINTANLLSERYEVEIISVYNMPDSPAFPLSDKVSVRYLLSSTPNREQWKQALRERNIAAFVRESFRAVEILSDKRRALIKAIKSIKGGVIISTRHEDNLLLSKYGRRSVRKIAQLHHDHGFDKKLMRDFRKGYGNIDVFMLLCRQLADEVREQMDGNDFTRVIEMPNFLEALPENVEAGNREKMILAVGRLDRVKGFDRLIESFARVHEQEPEWKLCILGEGSERERLEALVEKRGLSESVELPGKVDSFAVEQHMRRASVYAMSSHSEGFPFVLVEALSCKLPVVAYDVRVGPGAVLRQNVDGFMVKDGDSRSYEEMLLRLMRDEQLRLTLAEQAAQRAEEFSRVKLAHRWYNLLEELYEA